MGAIKRSESLNTYSKGVAFVHCVMVNAFAFTGGIRHAGVGIRLHWWHSPRWCRHSPSLVAFATPSDAPASQRDGWRMPPGAANAATTMPAKAAFTKRRTREGFVSTGG